MKCNSIKKNWMKHLLQWGVLIMIIIFLTKVFGTKTSDPEAYCPMGGLETLATYLVNGSMACSMTMVQIMMGGVLALGVILFGKLFCGYICPLGLVNELFYRLRRKLKITAIRIKSGSVADKVLRIIKYALLFFIFYMTLSSSELFCKNFDPYYAVATGFKGELTIWMAVTAIGVLVLGSLLVDMFWCKYICPLGAASNIFKFTLWFVGLVLIFVILTLVGINVPWLYLLAAACIMGYLLEILTGKHPKLNPQMLTVVKNEDKCNNCGMCEKRCPHHIEISKVGKVKDVDCTLCGECVAACKQEALTITKCKCGKYLPAIIVVVLFFIALYLGNKTELPTIDLTWNTEQLAPETVLEKAELTGLTSVKCYGSSMAFKAKLERVPGVYGVKTFVKRHAAVVTYNPAQTDVEAINKAIFVPTTFRVGSPEAGVDSVKIITIRTEKMYDKMDPNYLGLQLRNTDKRIYGIETEYACPLIVRIYMHPEESYTEDFFEEIVEKDVLMMPVAGGEAKEIPCDFEFVKLEKGESFMAMRPYLEKMFKTFEAEYKQNIDKYAGQPMEIMEFADQNYEKPIIMRNIPFLSNLMLQQDGVIGTYLVLNEDNVPAIQIKYAKNITNGEKLLKEINKPVWNISYKDGSKEESARFNFDKVGTIKPVR
ncbi:MAG: 4Fe-4S binding protein [Bacteroidales bacterium]|nr:4Fe-4S binding protein [Bacteroidales bacterium]MDD4669427.1 4Fe-4S binding protein [Bacteroidales bacterium]